LDCLYFFKAFELRLELVRWKLYVVIFVFFNLVFFLLFCCFSEFSCFCFVVFLSFFVLFFGFCKKRSVWSHCEDASQRVSVARWDLTLHKIIFFIGFFKMRSALEVILFGLTTICFLLFLSLFFLFVHFVLNPPSIWIPNRPLQPQCMTIEVACVWKIDR